MGKKKEEAPLKTKKKGTGAKADVLRVSKSIKVMAAMASLRGFNPKQVIRVMGEAEQNFKNSGRLVFN